MSRDDGYAGFCFVAFPLSKMPSRKFFTDRFRMLWEGSQEQRGEGEGSWVSKKPLFLDCAPDTGLGVRARVLGPSSVGLHDSRPGRGPKGCLQHVPG